MVLEYQEWTSIIAKSIVFLPSTFRPDAFELAAASCFHLKSTDDFKELLTELQVRPLLPPQLIKQSSCTSGSLPAQYSFS